MKKKDQDRFIAIFRGDAIKALNINAISKGEPDKLHRERSAKDNAELPYMCSGCNGFFSKSYKSRHKAICSGSQSNLSMTRNSLFVCLNVANESFEGYSKEFLDLLKTLRLDRIGDYIKGDKILMMIGYRSFNALRRKKDKKKEVTRTVRSRMRLLARVYLPFKDIYNDQSEITLTDPLKNAADMYRRETIYILGQAINQITDPDDEAEDEAEYAIGMSSGSSVTGQKSGLKISILNLLKLSGKFLIGHFLIKNLDARSKQVLKFFDVLKYMENEIFGDAFYDLNYRRNVNLRKPIHLPKDEDIRLLMEECISIMEAVDVFKVQDTDVFVRIRAAAATFLIIFNARRGGEPVRLFKVQWQEALDFVWIDQDDLPEEYSDEMLVTFITGKGVDRLVPILFPPEVVPAMRYLNSQEVREAAGVAKKNP